MKKLGVVLVVVCLVVVGALVYSQNQISVEQEFIRIHIRANSDTDFDQAVKLRVRDGIIELLTPVLAECEDFDGARTAIFKNLKAIEARANQILKSEGLLYKAMASLVKEDFPARSYGDLTLKSGIYDALIVQLGNGDGENWWCVAFPPLCFVPSINSNQVVYKSKILEIIQKYKDKK